MPLRNVPELNSPSASAPPDTPAGIPKIPYANSKTTVAITATFQPRPLVIMNQQHQNSLRLANFLTSPSFPPAWSPTLSMPASLQSANCPAGPASEGNHLSAQR